MTTNEKLVLKIMGLKKVPDENTPEYERWAWAVMALDIKDENAEYQLQRERERTTKAQAKIDKIKKGLEETLQTTKKRAKDEKEHTYRVAYKFRYTEQKYIDSDATHEDAMAKAEWTRRDYSHYQTVRFSEKTKARVLKKLEDALRVKYPMVDMITLDPVKVRKPKKNVVPLEESKMRDARPINRTLFDCELNLPIDESMIGKCAEQAILKLVQSQDRMRCTEKDIRRWTLQYRQQPKQSEINPMLNEEPQEQEITQEQINQSLDGMTPLEVEYICKQLKMSCYALDTEGCVLVSYTHPNSKSKSLCFVTDGTHLYPINQKEIKKRICQLTKGEKALKSQEHEINPNFITVKTIKDITDDMKGDIFVMEEEDLHQYYLDTCRKYETVYDFTRYSYRGMEMVHFQDRPDRHIRVCPDIQNLADICKKLDLPLSDKFLSAPAIASHFYQELNNDKPLEKSVLTKLMIDTLLSNKHRGGIMEHMHAWDEIADMDLYGADIRKCYTSVLLNEDTKLPILDVFSEFTETNDQSIDDQNLYKVQTNNMFPLRGSQIYTGAILNYARSQNIDFKITHVCRVNKTINQETMINFVKNIYEKLPDSLAKILVNSTTGVMSMWNRTRQSNRMAYGLDEASRFHFTGSDICDLGNNFLAVRKTWNEIQYKTNIPAHMAIIQYGWIALHKMCVKLGMQITQQGLPTKMANDGKLVRMVTDSVMFALPKGAPQPNIPTTCEIGQFKALTNEEVTKKLKRNKAKPIGRISRTIWSCVKRDLDFSDCEKQDWAYLDIDEENYREPSYLDKTVQTLSEFGSFYISGRAGTGKTFLVKKLIEKLRAENKKVFTTAFTNSVARNIGETGQTLHRLFNLSVGKPFENANLKQFNAGDILVVDEISMVPHEFYAIFQQLKHRGVTMIFLGDFEQLAPVGQENARTVVLDSYVFRWLCDFHQVELLIRKRYDEKLGQACDKVLNGVFDKSSFQKFAGELSPEDVHITYLNETRQRINEILMDKMAQESNDEEALCFEIEKSGIFQPLNLVTNSPIVCIKSCKEHNIKNAEEFVVGGWDENTVHLMSVEDGKEYCIENNLFCSHFTSGHGTTGHRAMGKTYGGRVIIHDANFHRVSKHWLYTVLTRATKWENIFIA